MDLLQLAKGPEPQEIESFASGLDDGFRKGRKVHSGFHESMAFNQSLSRLHRRVSWGLSQGAMVSARILGLCTFA